MVIMKSVTGLLSVLAAGAMLLSGCTAVYEDNMLPVSAAFDDTRESADIRLEDDFYGYTNFDFLWNNEIPAGMPEYSTLAIVTEQVDDALDEIIMALTTHTDAFPAGSDEQKIRDLYLQYLDTESREAAGLEPLEKGIEAVWNADTVNEFISACGRLYTDYGCSVLFSPLVSEDFYDNSRYTVYLGQMSLFYPADELLHTADAAENLQESIGLLLEVTGGEQPEKHAYDLVTMLLDIAESTSEMRDVSDIYHLYTPQELEQLLGNIRIPQMLEAFGIGDVEALVVCDVTQTEKINSYLTDEYLPLWKSFAVCRLLYSYAEYLPEEYSAVLNAGNHKGMKERALSAVKTELANEVGNLYARQTDVRTLEAVIALADDIRAAYRRMLSNSAQIGDEEREKLIRKLDNMTFLIGTPEEAYHSGSVVAGSLLESCVSIRSAQTEERLSLCGTPVRRNAWEMLPQTVNALYSPENNSLTIPAAMFDTSVFDRSGDRYTNLGGLGSVIAHEMTHAFDKTGIEFDETGCYSPGWMGETGTQRNAALKNAAITYFGSKTVMDIFPVDGELTAGENVADLGGMQVIVSMTDDPEALRRIFESYAHLWATLSYDTDAAENLLDDVHSPEEIRTNAVLSSLDKFYAAYDIAETDGMYTAPAERVRVW